MQERSKETLRKTKEALQRLMASRSYSEITVSHICAEAGISVGAFYHHFRSKDELFLSILSETRASLSARLGPLLTEDAFRNIRQYVFMTAEKYTGMDFEYVRELFIAHIRMSQDHALLYTSPNFVLLCGILRDGQARGQIRGDLTAEAMAEQIVMLCEGWQHSWCVSGGSYSLTEYVSEQLEPLLAMLKG